MKNNREKLTHAFEGLQGYTLREAVVAMDAPVVSSKTHTRRFVTLTAACLAAVMVLGAVAAVPFLTADDPTVPVTGQGDVSDMGVVIESPEEHYPFVRVQALSAETEEGEQMNNSVSVDMSYSRIMLTFNCDEGETVEITSHYTLNQQTAVSEKMEEVLMEYERMELTDHMLQNLERMLYREIRRLESSTEAFDTELSKWEPDRVITQISEYSFLVCKRLFRGSNLSDVVDFVIRNESGEIVGAGSICFAVKVLYSSDMIRYEILGSKRFDTPVTEEEVAAYLGGLHEKTEATIAGMDFTPVTPEEGYEVAKTDLIATCYGDEKVRVALDVWTQSASFWEFRFLYPRCRGEKQEDARNFILFSDGTWGEIAEDSDWIDEPCTDASCTVGEDAHEHRVGRNLVLADGRSVSIERQLYVDDNGQTLEKYVAVFAPEVESA